MKNKIIIFCLLITLLNSCSGMHNGTIRSLNGVEENTKITWEKTREYLGVSDKKPKKPEKTQERYCYHTYQDIVCYKEQIAGAESRLLAYQGTEGETGYVFSEKENSKQDVISKDNKKEVSAEKKPVKALKPLKSVNVSTPPKIADDKEKQSPPNKIVIKKAELTTNSETKKKDEKKLKEIVFDPSELQPKELVPKKIE
ncbi:MAG: hypothetical protein WCJ33_03035 [Pseudomonadota bacterium]